MEAVGGSGAGRGWQGGLAATAEENAMACIVDKHEQGKEEYHRVGGIIDCFEGKDDKYPGILWMNALPR